MVISGKIPFSSEFIIPPNFVNVNKIGENIFLKSRIWDSGIAINYWMDPAEAYALCREIARGKMKGRTMYVIPYSMGVVGSDFAKIGIEVTDSIYVVLTILSG